jgi:glycosyltransferase involved in cell wall biosynthesis
MRINDKPLVSIVTPVYNGEAFLAECIESVLQQTYRNYEYLIVNNCSTDRTLEIALSYAIKDQRIRVHTTTSFLEVMDNHNGALALISKAAKYCKVVCADDFIFPECIMRMVECAEAHPSVGIVGSYQLSGDHVKWRGVEYPQAMVSGREIGRRVLLTRGPEQAGFGTPTSTMYRADLVRSSGKFYPNPSPHSDTSACFKYLQSSDFGFVFQVLSYERKHKNTESYKSAEIHRNLPAIISDILEYGHWYLNSVEYERCLRVAVQEYRRFLAVNYLIGFRGSEFWSYHKNRLDELGYPTRWIGLLRIAIMVVSKEALNPELAIRKLWLRLFPNSAEEDSSEWDGRVGTRLEQ